MCTCLVRPLVYSWQSTTVDVFSGRSFFFTSAACTAGPKTKRCAIIVLDLLISHDLPLRQLNTGTGRGFDFSRTVTGSPVRR